MKLLNIGCGTRFHKDWVNIDLVSDSKEVIQCDILKGLPFADATFDVVYNSHFLEHLSYDDGKRVLKECWRVLKANGVLRIVLPDLERMINQYFKNLQRAENNEEHGDADYEWILLELFDQASRNISGGDMLKYLLQSQIPNKEYVFYRIGQDSKKMIDSLKGNPVNQNNSMRKRIDYYISRIKYLILRLILGRKGYGYYLIGKFRKSGEIHYTMYDKYRLSKLLTLVGFLKINILNIADSSIPKWKEYQLEDTTESVSLIIEAEK